MSEENARRQETVKVPISMPGELEEKIVSASRRLKLSKQDTMRLSLERGLAVLEAQLTSRVPEMAS